MDRACGVGIGSGASFYQRLNELLEAERFDEFVEGRCAKFYAEKNGVVADAGDLLSGALIGYFEGIGAERGIAWRLADSLALRRLWASRWTSTRGSLDDFAHAAADRSGHASRSIRLGVGRAGRSWFAEGPADRD